MIHLVVEKYRSGLDPNQQPKLITVTFNRYNKECLVNAIMEFLEYNFTMLEPPKYRDCEGDMILLDSKEAFEVAVDDIQRTSHKIFVVHLNGIYKYEFENNQREAALTSPTEIRQQIQKEIHRQMWHHPIILQMQRSLAQIKDQMTYGTARKEMKTAQAVEMIQVDGVDAKSNSPQKFGCRLPSIEEPLGNDDEQGQGECDFIVTEEHFECYANGKGEWTLESWKKIQANFEENVAGSFYEVYKGRPKDEIICKQWTVRRISSKQWDNVVMVNEYIFGPLEIISSKMETLYSKGQGQIVKFTVWMFYPLSYRYVHSVWRLVEITNCGQQKALKGDKLIFRACFGSTKEITNGNSSSEIGNLFADGANHVEVENPNLRCEVNRTERGTVCDTLELEHLSYESVVASDYEVIDAGDIVAGNSDRESQKH